MADPVFDKQQFQNIQTDIKAFRSSKDSSRLELRAMGEKLKKLKQQLAQAQRSNNQQSVQSIQKEIDGLQAKLNSAEGKNRELLKQELPLLKAFDLYSDPRTAIKLLDDSYPILLFPVRLETRFKIVQNQHQLWVRIFPDECSINSFDSVLSESEQIKIRSFWVSKWKTGISTLGTEALKTFIRNKELGNWKMLMGSFNAGRSYWLTQNYLPVNASEIPVRTSESDIHLIIPCEVKPTAVQIPALQNYWKTVLLAKGDATQILNAFTTFRSATGESEDGAKVLLEKYAPQDFETEAAPEGPVTVLVTFIQFPPSATEDTKLSAWAQAARVTTLPDRFVLMGYQKNNPVPVINQLGNFVPDPLFVGPDTKDDIEKVLIEEFGPEIANLPEEEKAVKYIEYLSKRSETKWLFDFDEAVKMGLGFKINLTEQVYQQGFEKLFVLGVKISADKEESQTALENLIKDHHFGDANFSIIPQGTPTNNTEDGKSGYTDTEDSDEAYKRYFENTETDFAATPALRRDGAWMSQLLGIDSANASLDLVQNYYHKDQMHARAMNTALWNATLGYFLDSIITPVTTEEDRERLRWFLIEFVNARGKVPAFRVKNQPYGILPISKSSSNLWLAQDDAFRRHFREEVPFLSSLLSVMQKVRTDWEKLTGEVAYVGKGGDAHKNLLQAVGLHAGSVKFEKRTAQSFSHIINLLTSQGILGDEIDNLDQEYKAKGMQLLQKLGYTHDTKLNPAIPILEKYFLGKAYPVERPLVDDIPLSEEKLIRAYTSDDKNYVEWLLNNALNNHSNIKDQKGFKDNKIPQAILYDMLRHALNLEFGNTGLKFLRAADILSRENVRALQIDSPFIGIQTNHVEVESKWDILYRKEPVITQNESLIAEHISVQLRDKIVVPENNFLHEVTSALEILKDAPTASLERCLTEHLDLCSYRLDAWLSGFKNLQLQYMRFGGSNSLKNFNPGIYLGAFGMIENLKPENKTLSRVRLSPELKTIFDPEDKDDITTDNTNGGYIHAPSINHGLTAAVLRNAYISNATKEDAELYKVNLSSERVRMAMGIIEGMQQGQGLGELLGYQLERGLHDNNTEEMNSFIYDLRKVFPLKANKLKLTELRKGRTGTSPAMIQRIQEEDEEMNSAKAITKVQANNVINGLGLIEQINKSGVKTYPFGLPIGTGMGQLMQATANEAKVINTEVERILNIRDAVADLAIAESVHQVVQGNYDRAAGSLDAFSKGNYPQFPDVVSSPASGKILTHRFTVHLPGGIDPATGTTPRSKAQASVNEWLKNVFPANLADIVCKIKYTVPNYLTDVENTANEMDITLANLGLQPIDLLYLVEDESDKNLTALDDYILNYFHTQTGPKKPDMKIEINYTTPVAGKISFFEMAALISQLKSLLISSRPLQPNDIVLPNEAKQSDNGVATIVPSRITSVVSTLQSFNTTLKNNFVNVLNPLIDDEDPDVTLANTSQIIDQIDALAIVFVQQMNNISLYGNKQSGYGYFLDRKAGIFAGVYKKVATYIKTWKEKLAKFNDIINTQLPAAADEETKINLLQQAERLINTEYTIGFTDSTDLKNDVLSKKPAFESKLAQLETFVTTNAYTIKTLLTSAESLNTGLDLLDTELLDFAEDKKQVVILAEDMRLQVSKLNTALTAVINDANQLVNDASLTAIASEKLAALSDAGKLLFGEDFKLIPEFYLDTKQVSEIQNCLASQAQLLNHQTTQLDSEFPVDDWLYGIARVREKLAAWESTVMFAEGFNQNLALNLSPLQLPYKLNDSWLAMEYPEAYEIDSDKLIYTASMNGFNPAQPVCGVLVDEWTEVIPAKKETTGLTFHYDRPNSEPPQALLLATPETFKGEWNWDELVGCLHETLAMARLRALEPDIIDHTGYAQFLPATVAAFTAFPVTMALNYGIVKNFSN